jgi:hypothetical protein
MDKKNCVVELCRLEMSLEAFKLKKSPTHQQQAGLFLKTSSKAG